MAYLVDFIEGDFRLSNLESTCILSYRILADFDLADRRTWFETVATIILAPPI
jgi:hypothetical protein